MSEGTRILERDGEPAWVRRRATLSVLEGPSSPRTIELEGTVHVGSGPRMDVRLEDPAVSAHHFELSVDDQGWRLRDVESTNGTYVLGLRCRDVRLADGVEIRAGETRLRFALGDDDVAVPLSRRTNFGGLIGHSAAMRSAFAVLERAAKSDATVLITGESGTGKELAARAVHDASPRSGGPYVVFDCGAAAPSLLESQLFGHVKGAFTGAVESRAGVFEEADGGTLVLDELGELPLELQPKLLRALEHRTVTRIGDHEPIRVDVRFVACTNRSLTDEVQRGAFREDLFFRVSVLTVRLPALRERPEEIGRLIKRFTSELDVDVELPPSTLRALTEYRWPGNVRELRNVVERMVAFSDLGEEQWMPTGASKDVAPSEDDGWERPFHEAKQRWIDLFERSYVEKLFARHRGNVSEAARAAGLSRQTCYRLMDKHGLGSSDER